MPNGGSICCAHCANGSLANRCEVFGTEVTPFYLCLMFRLERQTNDQARNEWHLLTRLEPGVVYKIDNSYPGTPDSQPVPAFHVVPVSGAQ